MKSIIVKMRVSGVALPKRQLPLEGRLLGDLSISDSKSSDLNRIIRTAKFVIRTDTSVREEVLFDPYILWMHENRFVLTGFERVRGSRGDIDYAQSWLCEVMLAVSG